MNLLRRVEAAPAQVQPIDWQFREPPRQAHLNRQPATDVQQDDPGDGNSISTDIASFPGDLVAGAQDRGHKLNEEDQRR